MSKVFFPNEYHNLVGAYRERIKRLNLEYFAIVRDVAADPGAAVMLGVSEQTVGIIGSADRISVARVVSRGFPLVVPRSPDPSFWSKVLSLQDEEMAIMLAHEFLGGRT